MQARAPFRSITFLCLILPAALPAASITSTWIGAVNSDWNASGNWSNGIPDNASDTFSGVINNLTHNPVTIATGASDTLSNLTLGNSAGVTLNGTLTLAGSAGNGNLINAGSILIADGGNLNLSGASQSIAFSGNGTINLATAEAFQGIVGKSAGMTLTNGVGQTIQGYGFIQRSATKSDAATMNIVNNGTISANTSGQILTLGTTSESATNNGTVQAITGGELDFIGSLDNTLGLVTANAGTVKIGLGGPLTGSATGGNFSVINGGSLLFNGTQQNITVNSTNGSTTIGSQSVTGGSITLNGSSTLTLGSSSGSQEIINTTIQNNAGGNVNISGLTNLKGTLNNAAGGQVTLTSQIDENGLVINNNGDFRLQGAGGILNLRDSAFAFNGAGSVTLASGKVLAFTPTTLTNTNTIQGAGAIINQSGSTSTLINQGIVTANSSGGVLELSAFDVTNTGTLSASNGGTLWQQSRAITNSGTGAISANGGTVQLDGSVTGGVLNALNGGIILLNGTDSNNTINLTSGGSMTLEGHVTNGAATLTGVNTKLDLAGSSSTWSGSIDVGSGSLLQTESAGVTFTGNLTVETGGSMKVNGLSFGGSVAVTNNGGIAVSGLLQNQDGAALSFGGSGTLTLAGGVISNGGSNSTGTTTNGVGHTITGSGTIQSGGFTNYGNLNVAAGQTISDVTVGSLNPAATFDNFGSIIVAGQLLAGSHTTMNFDSGGAVTLNGGTLGSVAGATASALINNAGSTIEGKTGLNTISAASFTNNGSLVVDAGSQISINGGAFPSIVTFGGSQLLNGGSYYVGGTLKIDNAAIRGNFTQLALDGASAKVTDQNGIDALSGMFLNGTGAVFTLKNGATEHLTPFLSQIENDGNLFVGTGSSLSVTGEYYQHAGETEVNGALTATSVSVDGGVLAGTGTVSGPVTVSSGGTIAPGDDPGKLTINGSLTEMAGANTQIEIASGSSWDQLVVNGAAQLDGTLTLILLDGFIPANGESFQFLTWASNPGNTFFSNLIMPAFGGEYFTIGKVANGLVATFYTPEPGTWLTGLAGLTVLGTIRRRKKFVADLALKNRTRQK